MVLPISYLVVGDVDELRVVVRTRPGNVLDRPDRPACLEIDGVDAGHAGGWSVLVRGLLRPIEPSDAVDPHPLFADDRDAWLVLEPTVITGRRLVAAEQHWAFDSAGYLLNARDFGPGRFRSESSDHGRGSSPRSNPTTEATPFKGRQK